ncbi:MAG TPA: tetratricopeptide repeat protein [Vicinamibacterales bacterium]|nr:tetratricopeptide repeat protein [Vicinamibacterales bacterium]
MRKCSSPAGIVALVAMIGAAGCSQIGALKGKLAFKEANTLYKAENYEAAARKYQETLEKGCTGDVCNPQELTYAYFFLASSYDNLFRPVRKGDPKNDAYLTKAIEFYETAAQKIPDPEYKKRSLQYMAVAYGAEKLNDPAKAEPIIKRLIEMDPNDPQNYYQMSKLYEEAGDFEQAEAQLLKAKEVKPNDPEVYGQLARYYESRGNFEKQIAAMQTRAEKQPGSPEGHYSMAVVYWRRACVPVAKLCEPFAGPVNQRAKYVAAGLDESEKALALRDDYIDALAYKNLLLRSKAYLEPARAQELIKEADDLIQRIGEIRKRRAEAPAAATKPGAE